MKLDKIKFARLISFCANNGMTVGSYEIEQIDDLIDIEVPEPEQIYPNASLVTDLLKAMQEGKKIEAIWAHRAMTGMGLKESKDEVEKYFGSLVRTAE